MAKKRIKPNRISIELDLCVPDETGPGARPTNNISIEFEIRSKLGAL